MCRVSNQIKFCSCAAGSVEELQHYWIYHQFDKDRHFLIMGELISPYNTDPETDLFNEALLLIRINEPDAFDVDLHPKSKDRLQITITCDQYDQRTYGFVFKKGKWHQKEFNYFDWQYQHSEKEFGKIKNAIERKKTDE